MTSEETKQMYWQSGRKRRGLQEPGILSIWWKVQDCMDLTESGEVAELMTEAWQEEKDPEDLIIRKGWGCESCI